MNPGPERDHVMDLLNELRASQTSRIPLMAKTLGMANAWQDGFTVALRLMTYIILDGDLPVRKERTG